MADGEAGPSQPTPQRKGIPSLARRPMSTPRLKFTPILAPRRKKEETKQEQPAEPATIATPARGRGRGRGDGRGRGRGDSGPRPPVEMVASGPFAMGPSMGGPSTRRGAPSRSNFAPAPPLPATGDGVESGKGEVSSGAKDRGYIRDNDVKSKDEKSIDQEEEVYSEPDDGVEIVDMDHVGRMDWMAPESLKREREGNKKAKKAIKVEVEKPLSGGATTKMEEVIDMEKAAAAGEVDLANALDLSESEEEEELEDIIEDFSRAETMEDDEGFKNNRLYVFAFPAPFPDWTSGSNMEADQDNTVDSDAAGGKRVSFAADVKSETSVKQEGDAQTSTAKTVDGRIGQLEFYRSGAVKIRLQNNILLEVNTSTQPSFYQEAVYTDSKKQRLCAIGEVNKRFTISPDVDALLQAMEEKEANELAEMNRKVVTGEGMYTMDTT